VSFGQFLQSESDQLIRSGEKVKRFQSIGFGVFTSNHFERFLDRGVRGLAFVTDLGDKALNLIKEAREGGDPNHLFKDDETFDFAKLCDLTEIKHPALFSQNTLIQKAIENTNLQQDTSDSSNIQIPNKSTKKRFWHKVEFPDALINKDDLEGEIADNDTEESENSLNLSAQRLVGFYEAWNILFDAASTMESPLTFRASDALSLQSATNLFGYQPKKKGVDIPVSIALNYLDGAINYVSKYGEALAKYVVELNDTYNHIRTVECSKARQDHVKPKAFKRVKQPKELDTLKVIRFHNFPTDSSRTFADLRTEMSVPEAIKLLYASTYILATTFTASRPTATRTMRQNCLKICPIDGKLDLAFKINKVSKIEELNQIHRPIPQFVGKAVDFVGEISESLYKNSSNHFEEEFLFAKEKRNDQLSFVDSPDMLQYIAMLADFTEIPVINNSRWYLRPSQLRRFFAMAYFHWDKQNDLNSLSWLMGHSDIEETFGYYSSNIIGDEISQEAKDEAASAVKSAQSKTVFSEEIKALVDSTEKVLGDLNFINNDILGDYLEEQLKQNNQKLSICRITTIDNKSSELFIFAEDA